jgi:uncharacterized membrane protein YfcA
MSIRTGLLAALAVVTVAYTGYWAAALLRDKRAGSADPVRWPTALELFVGFLTDFFDTLGIGSYAPTTSLFKFFKLVPDENIPGSMNVGHCIPTFAEAFIYITIVGMDGKTLSLMIASSVLGAWLGAGVVVKWPRRNIQIGMGVALVSAAIFFTMKNLHLFPAGGDTLGLEGLRLAVGLAGIFVLGALMTLGIGAYAPTMILVSLLGMNPAAAFPIMMGACAFLIPAANVRFIQAGRYTRGPSIGLTLGGTPGVLIAAFIAEKFFKLDIVTIRWGVICVVLYTAFAMLRSAMSESRLPAV